MECLSAVLTRGYNIGMESIPGEGRECCMKMVGIAETLVPSDKRELISNNVIFTALQLAGKVTGADGRFLESESAFLNAVARTPDDSVVENLEYVRRCQSKWEPFKTQVPEFLRVAVAHDKANGTRKAATLIDSLDKIGLLAAACDEKSKDAELSIVVEYINFLRRFVVGQGVSTKSAQEEKQEAKSEPVESLIERLNNLVGLAAVKKEVTTTVNVVRVGRIREQHGLKVPTRSLHLVFSGNPGTGKTTVARLLAEIYGAIGALGKGHLTETDRSGLVAAYSGQTALKVQELVKRSLGGILFIDEAYALAASKDDNYGREAIDTLLKLMEDHRAQLVVVVAGYTKPMQQFLDANPGLRSRFNKFVHFEDYAASELYEIFVRFCTEHHFTYDEATGKRINSHLEMLWELRDENFGNGRTVRNLFEHCLQNQANRIAARMSASEPPTATDLCTLMSEDVPSVT